MAKRSLLEMTQGILSAMDSDEVSSIADTVEAQQIARVIEDVYNDLVDEHDLSHTKDLFALEGQADVTKPTHMKIPQNVSKVEWIKYDRRVDNTDPKSYQLIERLDPLEFVQMCVARDSTDTTTYLGVPYNNNITIYIDLTTPPHYWTSFDDEYIIFDSIDKDIDTTLQASKTICFGNMRPAFTSQDDDFIPDLPENLFGLLYNESMSRCFSLWKQSVLPKTEQAASRMRVRSQRNKWRQTVVHEGVDYGRRS